MDIDYPVNTSVAEDVYMSHDVKQVSPEAAHCNGGVIEGVSLNDRGNDLTEFLHIQDGHRLASNSILPRSSDKNENRNVEKEDECEEPQQTESTFMTSEKCLSKCTIFPSSIVKAPFAVSIDDEDEDGEDEKVEDEEEEDDITAVLLKQSGYGSFKPAQPRPVLLPSPLNLVSAMKGSREKQGTSPKQLSVTWASDVYDPPPSASTFVRIKKPRPKSESKKNYDCKKNEKNKQKGKPSKGGSGKDKKQARKYGGSSNKCYQSLNDDDGAVDYNQPSAKLGDFDVDSTDSYCGSSFLEKSVSKLHFSVAEAS